MKKILGAIALSGAAMLALAPSASAADCGKPAVAAVYKTVSTPATPDVFKTVKVVDVEAQPAVPAVPAKPGTPAQPAVEEVSHIEHRLVTPEVPATPEVKEVSHFETKVITPAVAAQHYSLKGKAKTKKYGTPPTPEQRPDLWQANTKKEPHKSGNVTWLNSSHTGLHYTSHDSKGNRDWFYFRPFVPAVTEQVKVIDVAYQPAKPAVPAVYEDVKVIDVEAKPAVPAVPATPEIPAKPAVEEVSHTEQVLVKTGTKATSKKVLVSKAVPATKDCAVPASSRRQAPPTAPPAELAFTGSEEVKNAALAFGLLALGGAAYAARRKTA